MKQYLAFYGEDYYPKGGMMDFIGDFKYLDEAIEYIQNQHRHNKDKDTRIDWGSEWGAVYCTKSRTHVWSST